MWGAFKSGVASFSNPFFKENCWFFVSIVQEILALNFAGVFRDGKTLKHPGWAPDCRVAIKRRCYAETEILDQTPVATEDIKQLFNTMGDHDLRTTFGRVIDILLRQHVKFQSSHSGGMPDVLGFVEKVV